MIIYIYIYYIYIYSIWIILIIIICGENGQVSKQQIHIIAPFFMGNPHWSADETTDQSKQFNFLGKISVPTGFL